MSSYNNSADDIIIIPRKEKNDKDVNRNTIDTSPHDDDTSIPPPSKRVKFSSPQDEEEPSSSSSENDDEEHAEEEEEEEMNAKTLAKKLQSKSIQTNIKSINYLLIKSSDHELNYALNEGGELVVNGLCSLYDRIVGWPIPGEVEEEEEEKEKAPDAASAWISFMPNSDTTNNNNKKKNLWINQCQAKLSSYFSPKSQDIPITSPLKEAEYRLCEAILLIVRNLSYVSANLRFLAYSTDMLRVLCGCLYDRGAAVASGSDGTTTTGGGGGEASETGTKKDDRRRRDSHHEDSSSSSSTTTNLCLYAIHALINLAPYIDATGRKLFVDQVLADPTCSSKLSDMKNVLPTTTSTSPVEDRKQYVFGQATKLGFGGLLLAKRYHDSGSRDETLSRIDDYIVQGMVYKHVQMTFRIFGAISDLLDYYCYMATTTSTSSSVTFSSSYSSNNNRAIILSTLELLRDLVDNADNQAIFLSVPNSLLHRLVSLLWVPRLGPDSLEYVDPVYTVVSRVSTLKLLNGYDATIDSELRDKSVELLIRLTNLSPDVKIRLGRCWVPSSSSTCRKFGVGGGIAVTNDSYTTQPQNTPSTNDKEEDKENKPNNNSGNGGAGGYLTTRPNARLYDSLIPMLATKVGRNDASQLASRLLANMALVSENRVGMLYVEHKVVELTALDAQVANVACNAILNQIHG